MNEYDKHAFSSMMMGIGEMYNLQISEKKVDMWFGLLENYSIADIRSAMRAHCIDPEKSKFAPQPGDLVAQMNKVKKAACVSPDEAWLIASATVDEANTVVWTEAIQEARWSVDMDQFNASTCFKTEYKRILEERNYEQGKWTHSLGTNPQLREQAINDAVVAGRITHEYAQKALPSPTMTFSQSIGGMAKAQAQLSHDKPLVADAVKNSIAAFIAFAAMKEIVKDKTSAKGYAVDDKAEAKRLAEEELKAKKVIGDE